MMKNLAAYLACIGVMVALDALWLGMVARTLYQQGIGHLMAEHPNFAVAAVFYVVYGLGIMWFAVAPGGSSVPWGKTVGTAALFGVFCYATYNLTNLATLRDWPFWLSILDMTWGMFITSVAAVAGKLTLDRLSAG